MSGILSALSSYAPAAPSGGTFPSGLTVWARFKASDMVATGNGNPLAQWDDKTGNTRHLTQSTSARKPLLRTSASGLVGNTVAIDFLGDDTDPQCLNVPDMTALTTAFIAAYLINDVDATEVGSNANIRRIWELGSATDGYYKYTNTSGAPTGIYETFGTTARKYTGDTTPDHDVLNVWHSYMVASASGAFTSYINNTQFFTTATNTVGLNAAGLIGGNPGASSGTRLANKKFAEIVICSAVPNSTDRGLLQTYFTDEYA